ncbi:MAG: class I SAM-dependent methyltransferase, partial [Nocardioides sp.]
MSDDPQPQARSFGSAADAYHRGRPTYPANAVSWLATGVVLDEDTPGSSVSARTVLELGAGTGKLTASLLAQGHDVHATEPDEGMIEVLRRDLPAVRTSVSGAEAIPLADASVDVVVAAQCFHWFDAEPALDEISRVLKPGGHLALVWHERDERIPWVKKLGRIIGNQEHLIDPAADLGSSARFGEVEEMTFKHWQVVNRRTIVDLALSRSNIAVMTPSDRDATIAELLALYDDYGRGMDGMQIPYRTRCFRSRVLPRPKPAPLPQVEWRAQPQSPPARPHDPALDLPALALDPLTQPTQPISRADAVAAGLGRSPTAAQHGWQIDRN